MHVDYYSLFVLFLKLLSQYPSSAMRTAENIISDNFASWNSIMKENA